jgi:hypothetical protein
MVASMFVRANTRRAGSSGITGGASSEQRQLSSRHDFTIS